MSSVPIVSTLSGEKSVACPLNISDPAFDESLKDIITSAGSRWLKNEEVHKLLDSVQEQVVHVTWPQEPAEKPEGGRLFMFSRKVCRGFRNDKHSWRKKQDGRTVKETHEKLKVGEKERLNCYYAHAEEPEGLQRRCYWILEQDKDDTVLVHYLCSTTSRVGQRASAYVPSSSLNASAGGRDAYGIAGLGNLGLPSRPQRAAAQRARNMRFGEYSTYDSDEEGKTQSWDAANLPRENSQGRAVPVQAVDISAQLGGGGGGGGGGAGYLDGRREDSFLDNPYLKALPYNPEWHTLPSLREQEVAAREGRLGTGGIPPSSSASPWKVQQQQGQQQAPGSPIRSPSGRPLLRDPTGSGVFLLPMMSLGIDPLIDFGLSFPPRGPSDGGNSLFLHPFPSTDPQADQNQQQQQQQQQRSGAAVPTPLRTFFSQHRDNSLEVGLSALVSEAFRATTASIQQQQRGSADVATLVEAPGDGLQTMSIGGDAGGGEEERVHSPSRPSTAAAAGLGAAIAIAGGGGVPTAALDQEEGVGGSDEIGADEDGKANQWRHQDSHPPLAGRALLHQESRVARTIDREGGLTISGEDSGPPKVETIRRVMAPGFGQYGASLDVTSLADIATTTTTTTTTTTSPRMDVAKEEKHQHQHHRRNPTTAPGPPSTEDRIAAAVNAAAAYTSGKREEKVFLARQTRQEDQKPDHRAVVVVEAEEATALLKEMSIDKNVAILSSELPSSVPCQTPALGSLPESDNQ